jgi:digeranylgeranylglycerophospholipid reductase
LFDVDLTVRGFFGWLVPEDARTARIGIGIPANGSTSPKNVLNKHLDKIKKLYGISKLQIIDRQAGLIPMFDPFVRSQDTTKTIFLLGDAAGQVKSTTGGGLVPGLKAAAMLAECIYLNKKINKSINNSYDLKWKTRIGPGLLIHNIIKARVDSMSDNRIDKLIRDVSSESVKKVLASNSRDKPIKMVLSLMFRKPNLIRYAFL